MAQPPGVGGHHRPRAGHRLQRRHAERLPVGGQAVHVRGLHGRGHAVTIDVAEQLHPAQRRRLADAARDRVALGAHASHAQPRLRQPLAQRLERVEQHVDALAHLEVGEEQHVLAGAGVAAGAPCALVDAVRQLVHPQRRRGARVELRRCGRRGQQHRGRHAAAGPRAPGASRAAPRSRRARPPLVRTRAQSGM